MKFSKRTNWELTTNRFSEILEQYQKAGQNVFDLTQSNPTRCGFYYPAEIPAALSSIKNLDYSPSTQGLLSAREAICADYLSKGITVDPSQVFLTASTSESYSFLFRLLANPGDTVLFPQPSYPLFQFLVDLNDLQMATYRLFYEKRWRFDFKDFSAAIHPQVRAMVVVNPNNPTGSAFSDDERHQLKRICQSQDMALICDEVFLDYPFDSQQPLKTFLGSPETLVFVLGGLSKTLALPQMKLGWIVMDGPAALVAQARERLEVIADTYLSVNTPAQNALPTWLTHKERIHKDILNRIRRNRQQILNAKLTGCRCLEAEGGWYAVLSLPAGFSEEELILRLLQEDQVVVHPGYFFDFEDGPFLVLSLLPSPEIFDEGLKRICNKICRRKTV